MKSKVIFRSVRILNCFCGLNPFFHTLYEISISKDNRSHLNPTPVQPITANDLKQIKFRSTSPSQANRLLLRKPIYSLYI